MGTRMIMRSWGGGRLEIRLMDNDEGESGGDTVADVALFALSLSWGTVSQLIPGGPVPCLPRCSSILPGDPP